MNTEFDTRPFAAGTVVGLRSFRVAGSCPCGCDGILGVSKSLHAATNGYRWSAGENLASCTPHDSWPRLAPTGSDHRIASLNCTCGFYAYFSDRNDYAMSAWRTVTGIIEGYGNVTIGSLGFRAEKARIIALVQPLFDISEVLTQYPQVPIYPSVADALAAHRTTKPQDVGIDPTEHVESGRFRMGGWVVGGFRAMPPSPPPFQLSVSAMQKALDQLAASVKEATPKFTFITTGDGTVSGVLAEREMSPVERKRADAEAAAERRRQAGLRNSGGFDKRGRRN